LTGRRLRPLLAALRLALLYGLLWLGLLQAARLWQTGLEQNAGLDQPAPAALPIAFAGVNLPWEGTTPADRLAALRAAGFGWARQRIAWRALEPEPGRWVWAAADRTVDALAAAGLEPVVVLNGTPAWALTPRERAAAPWTAPPADFALLARFAEAFARRYGDRVRFYQIWDEPNLFPNWGARRVNPVEYAQMLRAVAPAIRRADPDAVILAAALAPTADRGDLAVDEVYFLQRMVAAGAAPALDVVAVQPLGFGYRADQPRQQRAVLNLARVGWVRRALVEAGLGDKAIWAVRYGWNRRPDSPWASVTPALQARYAPAALTRAWQEWPWLGAMGWALAWPGAAPPPAPEWGFALVEPDGSPAPLLAALADWQHAARPARPTAAPLPQDWLWVLVGAVGVGWRARAAARALEGGRWLAAYRRAPVWVHGGAWGGLAILYHLATFPPWVLLCGLGVAWLALAQPRVGLGLAAALLPFYYQHKELALGGLYWTVPPAHLLVLALLPAALAALGQPGAGRRAGWAAAPAALLVPLSLLSATSVWHWPAFGRGLLDLVLVPALLGLEVGLLAPAAADRRRLLLALFGGGVLAAGVGLAHWAGQQGTEVDGLRRLVGPHFSPNHTALYLERTLMVGVAACMLCARPGRWWLGGGTVGVAVALWLPGSRGALLLGVPAGLAVLAVAWRGGRQTLMAAFGAGLLGLALFWLGGQERLVNWETVGLRWQLWQASWALWQEHFWAGVGPGGFFWQYPAYLPAGAAEVDVPHPHSFWLELATTWGVGGLLWGALVGGAFVRALGRQWRAGGEQRWIAVGVGAGCAAGLAHGQSDAFLLWADLAAWQALAWALLQPLQEGQTQNVLPENLPFAPFLRKMEAVASSGARKISAMRTVVPQKENVGSLHPLGWFLPPNRL
jgi:hypothetical protein